MGGPQVSEPMRRLASLFVGSWRGKETLFPTPWDPIGGQATGAWEVRAALDGFCVQVDYEEHRQGSPDFCGHGVHGWDAQTEGFLVYWFDNMGAVPAAGSPATLQDNTYRYVTVSPRRQSRFTYIFAPDQLDFTLEVRADGADSGGWLRMHHGTYTRAA